MWGLVLGATVSILLLFLPSDVQSFGGCFVSNKILSFKVPDWDITTFLPGGWMINSNKIQGCIYEIKFLEPIHKIQSHWHRKTLFSLIKSKLDLTVLWTFGVLKTVRILLLLVLCLWRTLTNAHPIHCSRIPFLQRK